MDFSSMSGWDFERYCADCLLKKGFTKAEVTSGSGDHGVDIIAEQNGIRFGIQCKLYQGQIPNKAVQEAYTGASYYDCDVAVIMSNSELTKQAQTEAKKLRVKFWNIADYMPEDHKESSQEDDWDVADNSMSGYKAYEQKQKIFESHLESEMQIKLKKADNNEGKDFLLPELKKSANKYRYAKAAEWLCLLKSNKETWYPFIRSMQSFYGEIGENQTNEPVSATLPDKLRYMKQLFGTFSTDGDCLLNLLRKKCEEVDNGLRVSQSSFTPVDAKTLNRVYWEILYLINQMNCAFESMQNIIGVISDNEYAVIEDKQALIALLDSNRSMIDFQGDLEEQVKTYQRAYPMLIHYQNVLSSNLKFCVNSFSFLQENQKIKELLEIQAGMLKQPNAKTRCEEKQKIEAEKERGKRRREERDKAYYMFLEAQERARPQFERELRQKREQQERIEQEKRKEQEAQEEQRRLLKEKQEAERKATIRFFVNQYNSECRKIDSETATIRKKFESRAQEEVDQAQKQIGEFLKQKEVFTLFRKKRDTELDAKIAVLDRHIEQVKQKLADELAKCEQNAEEKKSSLYKRILDEAEQNHIKDEVVQEIGK